jgi:hypothetical protein
MIRATVLAPHRTKLTIELSCAPDPRQSGTQERAARMHVAVMHKAYAITSSVAVAEQRLVTARMGFRGR